MSKRQSETAIEDGNQAYLKRQKIKHVATTPSEAIESSRQLRQLLSFVQDATKAKHGIQSFKTFLDNLLEEDKDARLQILREYLNSQKSQDDEDKSATVLEDIMQTWSFASQTNNESLLSLIPTTLTVLFKRISNVLDLSDYGIQLGRTILQKRQLELLTRGLTSNKTKTFLISPQLCLIREIVTYDGGALARQVFRVRESTFKSLGRNLGIRHLGEGVEETNKPSVRTNALRLVCSCLKYLMPDAKKELLQQRDIVAGLFRDVSQDPSFLLAETFETLTTFILRDEKLPRDAKSKLLNPVNLGRIVALYNYDQGAESSPAGGRSIPELIHEFLMLACTSNEQGVLYRQAGYYPRGVDPDAGDADDSHEYIDLGLDSLEWNGRFSDNVPVRNTTLSEFIQTLRPWSSPRQAQLLLAIFSSAPELVADYFYNKKSFTFEPKLTATWIGYSALLFSTIQLDVPEYFGHRGKFGRVPPPTAIVLGNILPLPLNMKILTRCLNQPSKLIRLFALRILLVAFEKLQHILGLYKEAALEFPIWRQAVHGLILGFSQRCPSMKDVLNVIRSISDDETITRNAASQLLVKYYEVVPQTALESKYDVSAALTKALGLLENSKLDAQESVSRTIEIQNLFQVANCSPGMRWFNRVDSTSFSPFTTMLRLAAEASPKLPLLRIHSILQSITKENGLFQSRTKDTMLEAIIFALRISTRDNNASAIYEFLDGCALRCSTTPIKYLDLLETIQSDIDGATARAKSKPLSLLLVAVAEQWTYLLKTSPTESVEAVASFLSFYFAAAISISEDKKIIKHLIKRCSEELPAGHPSRGLIERARKLSETISVPHVAAPKKAFSKTSAAQELDIADLDIKFGNAQPIDVDDGTALLRWSAKEVEESVEDGHVAALVMLLSSSHLSIRKESVTNLAKLASKIKASTYEEKEQIWLLLCEVMETARSHIEHDSLPTTISSFTANAIEVLKNPLHCLYPKLNKFLTQGPSWEVDKIPMMHSILSESPSLDDAYYREVDWLLSYFADALRTPEDMAIFHKRHVFEKLLSFYNNPYIAKGQKEKILRILYQATNIEGGSTTLVTRFSVLSWLEAQKGQDTDSATLRLLQDRVLATSDKDRISAWSNNSL